MAKFKRLRRFLERIGIKKKQQKESVDLASRSRSSRRFWPRKSESGTNPQTAPTTNNGSSRFGRLFRLLKIKSSKKSSPNFGGDYADDLAEDSNEYPDVTENMDLVSLPILSISSINTVSADGGLLPIEVSYRWGLQNSTISSTNLTSLTDLSDYQCNKRDLEISSKLTVSCQWGPQSMSTSLTSVTQLNDYYHYDREASYVSSELSSITSAANCVLMETEGEGIKEGYENGQQLEDNNQSVVEWIQPQSGCGQEEVVNEAEGEPSIHNCIDDMIVLFLPVIVTIVVTVCIYLLELIC